MKFFLPILMFAFSSSATPGPNNIMIMGSGLNFGIKRSIPHYLGISLGFPLMLLAVGLGLGSVFIQYPILHTVIKYVGALYLLYLTYKVATTVVDYDQVESKSTPLTFLQAAAFQWVNPKAWVMAVSAISAYTTVGDSVYWQIIIISTLFCIACFPATSLWLFFGAGLKQVLKDPKQQAKFNYFMAILLFASIFLIFLE